MGVDGVYVMQHTSLSSNCTPTLVSPVCLCVCLHVVCVLCVCACVVCGVCVPACCVCCVCACVVCCVCLHVVCVHVWCVLCVHVCVVCVHVCLHVCMQVCGELHHKVNTCDGTSLHQEEPPPGRRAHCKVMDTV